MGACPACEMSLHWQCSACRGSRAGIELNKLAQFGDLYGVAGASVPRELGEDGEACAHTQWQDEQCQQQTFRHLSKSHWMDSCFFPQFVGFELKGHWASLEDPLLGR